MADLKASFIVAAAGAVGVGLVTTLAVVTISSNDKEYARDLATRAGYTVTEVGGTDNSLCRGYNRTKFKAKTPAGEAVDGAVCKDHNMVVVKFPQPGK